MNVHDGDEALEAPLEPVAPKHLRSTGPNPGPAPDPARAPDAISAPDPARAPDAISAPDAVRAPDAISAPDAIPAPEDISTSGESSPAASPHPSPGALHRGASPILVAVFVLISTFVLYQLVGSLLTLALFGLDVGTNPGDANGLRASMMISQFVFLALPALLAVRLARWDVADTLRLRLPRLGEAVSVVVAIVALQFLLSSYLTAQNWFLSTYVMPEVLRSLVEMLEKKMGEMTLILLSMHSVPEAVFVWCTIALTPAICEEVVFRGAVQRSLERGVRLRWAFVITSIVFGLYHMAPLNLIVLTIIGFVLSVIVWRGNSLWLGMLAHAANNSIAVIESAISGPDAMKSEMLSAVKPPDLMTLAVALGALVIFIAAFSTFWNLTRSHSPHPSFT